LPAPSVNSFIANEILDNPLDRDLSQLLQALPAMSHCLEVGGRCSKICAECVKLPEDWRHGRVRGRS
jgi:hypothetical protein